MDAFLQMIPEYPEWLRPLLMRATDRFADGLKRDNVQLPEPLPLEFVRELLDIWARSDFVAECWQTAPAQMLELWHSGDLKRSYDDSHLKQALQIRLAGVEDEASLLRELRLFRRREMARIVWRDLMRWCPMQETTRTTSLLAEACIDGALDWLYADACRQWGTPYGVLEEGTPPVPQRLVVIGMGKLGAYELNVSSDIDLIFAFPAKGETQGGPRPLENQTFFTRLGQRLILALDKITADGFVFRVDMRLRPYGDSGALALSFAAMETYYQDQGRDWERYAMIKAWTAGGDREAGARLMKALRPFVYRRYIDFSAIEALRGMKDMIAREVRRRGLEQDIKLGSGGIREVEFVVQAFQLIRGGRNARLQERNLLKVLRVLAEEQLMPEQDAEELSEAYIFLRNVEHALQGLADQQTQTLPSDPLTQARIALSMGFADWGSFMETLEHHRQRVRQHFSEVVAPPDAEEDSPGEQDAAWSELWLGTLEPEEELSWLAENGFEEPERVASMLHALRESRRIRMLQTQGRERLDAFMPLLLQQVAEHGGQVETLQRLLRLVEAVARRTAYLVLLQENPHAFRELIRLCADSPWIAEELAQTPLLLDELLHAKSLYRPLPLNELKDELRQQMLRVPPDDPELQMDVLRQFKKANVLRVAASELRGTLPIMKVSDSLTWIAEAILEKVLELAWDSLVAKHGAPSHEGDDSAGMNFAIVSYGKLAGLELGHGSDLDLVFLHGGSPTLQTQGERPIDNGVFYTRLGQRIIHLLMTHTTAGQLYDVDLRLRPSGNSGLLVTSLKAFEQYQAQDAWTWEHQALVRARVVAGSAKVGDEFERIRREVLSQARDRKALQKEVREMRGKMRATQVGGYEGGATDSFRIKHDAGGMVDIEFMVQYGVLGWAHEHPRLMDWPDNIRILEEMGAAGVMAPEIAERLIEIYKAYRSRVHLLSLQKLPDVVGADEFTVERAQVQEWWHRFMELEPAPLI